MIQELETVAFLRFFYVHYHVTFPDKENFSIFGHSHETFPCLELSSFFGKFVQKSSNLFFRSFVQKKTQGSTKCPASQRRDSWETRRESIYLAPSKRQNQCKPVDQSLQRVLNNLKRQKKLKLIKLVDCFLDEYCSYSSDLITFETESFQAYHFLQHKELNKN